ncbi:MAG TPA: DUF5995 family protein [Bryobacteraceae bacterium]|nr:DUF5995 family protein [Bryobacteraceae bacterium]
MSMPDIPPPAIETIDGVLDALTVIIGSARAGSSRLGYFPALYRRVTREVQRGIAAGRFEDGPRMEKLDVIFANRYLSAYDDWIAGRPASRCWALAFDAASRSDCIILQHLLLGMNAHINLDLAIAAAEVAPGASLASLRRDFNEINQILFEQVNGVQDAIGSVAPLMWLLDYVGGRDEEKFVEFSLTKARDAAWMQAERLSTQTGSSLPGAISMADSVVTVVGNGVLNPPGWLLRAVLQLLVRLEVKNVSRVIDALA